MDITEYRAQHQRAFALVSAYVIMRGTKRVATIAFKHPRDGMGRTHAYVQWFHVDGLAVRGVSTSAGGGDEALQRAMKRLPKETVAESWPFTSALANDGGSTWDTRLRNAGFDVLQAV